MFFYLNQIQFCLYTSNKESVFSEKKEGQNRQELRDAFIKNGAIYLFKKKNLDKNTIKGKKSLSMIMPRKLSINIDEPHDLEVAKYLLK